MGRTRLPQLLLALGVLAASSGLVCAARLDKSACEHLHNELAYILATGARDQMERGPEWAKGNLTLEQLGNIKRLIELEEQLEFRCSMGRKTIAATKPRQRPVIPDWPERKPPEATNATTDTTPPKLRPQVKFVDKNVVKQGVNVKRKAAKAPPATSSEGPPPQETAAVPPPATPAPSAPARPKASRPEPRNAYVSPAEVNPFFVTGYGKPR